MNLSASISCRRPLPFIVDALFERLRATPCTVPTGVGRSNCKQIPLDDAVIDFLRTSYHGRCYLNLARGSLDLGWGALHTDQELWNHLRFHVNIPQQQVGAFIEAISDIIDLSDAVYGNCDLATKAGGPWGLPLAMLYLRRLYWWNHFGREFSEHLRLSQSLISAVYSVAKKRTGLQVVLTESPVVPFRRDARRIVLSNWPYFCAYGNYVSFPQSIRLDYPEFSQLVPPPGEFVVDGKIFRTARRRNKARQYEALNEVYGWNYDDWYTAMHVIRPVYCEMLGINADDMVVIEVTWLEKYEDDQYVDRMWENAPEGMPLAERIWRAHAGQASLMKDGFRSAALQFVRDRFFSTVTLPKDAGLPN